MEAVLTKLIKQQLSDFPFHNLSLLLGKDVLTGGTCFDQALRLKDTLSRHDINAQLHEAVVCMTGEKTHRLVRVNHQGKAFFLDAGSGWPTGYIVGLKDHPQLYEIAGIRFHVAYLDNHYVIRRHDGEKWLNMNRISPVYQDESCILNKYHHRYEQNLPFKNELRLSWMEGDRFYRVAGNQFFSFKSGECSQSYALTPIEILKRLERTAFPELIIDVEEFLGAF